VCTTCGTQYTYYTGMEIRMRTRLEMCVPHVVNVPHSLCDTRRMRMRQEICVPQLVHILHRDEDEDEAGDVCTTCASCFAPEGRGWTGLPYKPNGEWMRRKFK